MAEPDPYEGAVVWPNTIDDLSEFATLARRHNQRQFRPSTPHELGADLRAVLKTNYFACRDFDDYGGPHLHDTDSESEISIRQGETADFDVLERDREVLRRRFELVGWLRLPDVLQRFAIEPEVRVVAPVPMEQDLQQAAVEPAVAVEPAPDLEEILSLEDEIFVNGEGGRFLPCLRCYRQALIQHTLGLVRSYANSVKFKSRTGLVLYPCSLCETKLREDAMEKVLAKVSLIQSLSQFSFTGWPENSVLPRWSIKLLSGDWMNQEMVGNCLSCHKMGRLGCRCLVCHAAYSQTFDNPMTFDRISLRFVLTWGDRMMIAINPAVIAHAFYGEAEPYALEEHEMGPIGRLEEKRSELFPSHWDRNTFSGRLRPIHPSLLDAILSLHA